MFANQTLLNPTAITFTIFMAFLLWRLPREMAILAILCVASFVPMGPRIVVGGLDLTMQRLILLVAWLRILSRSEVSLITLNTIDKIFLFWLFMYVSAYTILWGSLHAFVNRLGGAYDMAGYYFVTRIFVQNLDDAQRSVKYLLLISVPIAATMLLEHITGKNMFSILGGVPLHSQIRQGQIRAQGPFPHPILAGDFGAVLLPLATGLWWRTRAKKYLILGATASTAIVVASVSSGPLISYLAGVAGLLLWAVHRKIRVVFWGVVTLILGLHLYMKAPVWALIMRLGTSGSAYHRFLLIDKTIKHFSDWWLLGIRSTAHWGPHFANLQDIANEYCRISVDSGVMGLTAFVLIIAFCFRAVGSAVRDPHGKIDSQKFLWSIGCSLLVYVIAFFGISYAGLDEAVFYLILGILSKQSAADPIEGT